MIDKRLYSDYFIAWITLLSGLAISGVAVYYSVAGLVSIFSAAVIPIIVMGVTLESSKLVATVWLKKHWDKAPVLVKIYLMAAIIILMMITSLGTFGYLSRAHSEQSVPSGDIMAKVTMYDEQIKTQRDNIEYAKKSLAQLDLSVDQMMSRTDDKTGARSAINLRRSQAQERDSLQQEISTSQKEIQRLNTERAPFASQLRVVESEVGPIKYIAALLYGDSAIDSAVLERAVRAVIILIVVVFDPLAVVLLLTSQYSFQYIREAKEQFKISDRKPIEVERENLELMRVVREEKEEEVKEAKLQSELVDIQHHTEHVEEVVDDLEEIVDNNILASGDYISKRKRRAYQPKGLRKKQKQVDT